MTAITVESNLPEIQAALDRLVVEIPARTEATITNLAPAIKDLTVERIRDHTPRSEELHEGETEHLGDTTVGEIIPGPESAELVFRQTKTVPWRGHEPLWLAGLLIQGGEGYYRIPQIDNLSAKMLVWPNQEHPVRVVNHPPMSAHPYVEEALAEVVPEVNRVLDAAGANLAFEILEVMRA